MVVLSEATKRDVENQMGIPASRITRVYNAPDPAFFNRANPQGGQEKKLILERYQINYPYLLYVYPPRATQPVIRKDWLDKLGMPAPTTVDAYEYNGFGEPARQTSTVSSTQVFDVQTSRDDLGRITQRIEDWAASGAQHGIEYRYPLLDRRLMEFAYALPPGQFLRGKLNRWIFRYAMDPILPPAVCWNTNKFEQSRVDALGRLLISAFGSIADELAARSAPPSRARYIDMPRLMQDLARARAGETRGLSHRRIALQFLDF